VVGVDSGGLDSDGVGLASRALGDSGGGEYTTGIPAYSGAATSIIVGVGSIFAAAAVYSTQTPDTYFGGGGRADSNLPPFIARRYCKKSDNSTDVPSGITIHFNSATCAATGWQSDDEVRGRTIVGVGTGNTDADSVALTVRTFNGVGGRG